MPEAHATQKFTRGDDWPIDGTAHNADWTPMNIEGATVEWMLQNADRETVLTIDDVGLAITDAAAGEFRIVVPRGKTVDLPPGTYRDQCRITNAEYRSTQWYGVIEVEESLFEQPIVSP